MAQLQILALWGSIMSIVDAYKSIYGDVCKHLIIIDHSRATCANCAKLADPDERSHISSWFAGQFSQGCGTEFKYASSHYGSNFKDTILDRRSDLEWVSPIV